MAFSGGARAVWCRPVGSRPRRASTVRSLAAQIRRNPFDEGAARTTLVPGAIILGIGGDNSNGAQGNFFEGCMTSGASSSASDDAVQVNIVAAGYGK